MVIDHAAINAMRAEGGTSAPAVEDPTPRGSSASSPPDAESRPAGLPSAWGPAGDDACADGAAGPPEGVHRLLKVRVPVIVRLARRIMPIAAVRRLSVGSIIEFNKSVAEPLELLVRNRPFARGHAVKVGENFGLLLVSVGDSPAGSARPGPPPPASSD